MRHCSDHLFLKLEETIKYNFYVFYFLLHQHFVTIIIVAFCFVVYSAMPLSFTALFPPKAYLYQ